MSAQHTPGLWHVHPEEQSSNRWIIAQADGASIADCSPVGPWVSRLEADANARLIAAAPELHDLALALFRAADENLIANTSHEDSVGVLFEAARATLAKVKGERA